MKEIKAPQSLFPKYQPPPNANPHEYGAEYGVRLATRVVAIAGALGVLGGIGTFFGFRLVGPKQLGDRVTLVESGLKVLGDSVTNVAKRGNALDEAINANLYISCKTLARVQPDAIPPQQCVGVDKDKGASR